MSYGKQKTLSCGLDLAKESKLLSIWYDMSVLRTTFRSVIRADENQSQVS